MNSYTIAVTHIVKVEAQDDETAIIEAMEKIEMGWRYETKVEIKERKP